VAIEGCSRLESEERSDSRGGSHRAISSHEIGPGPPGELVHQRRQVAGFDEYDAQVSGARQTPGLRASCVEDRSAHDFPKEQQASELDSITIGKLDVEDADRKWTPQSGRGSAASNVPSSNTTRDQAAHERSREQQIVFD
jgi:hypothetical protein